MNNSSTISDLTKRSAFVALYGSDSVSQIERWEGLYAVFRSKFGTEGARFFSSPGRTELGGNHTDHSNGIVLAAAIDLDSIAIAATNKSGRITVVSEGYAEPFVVDTGELEQVPGEAGTTTALIRGIASQFRTLGYNIGGFDACLTSDVLIGSGLSSSASVEVLIGMIFNALYNDPAIDPIEIANIGQFAENEFFGKPSGLMDQIACAVGGAMMIDFRESELPVVDKINLSLSGEYILAVVNTGGSHANLTEDYAAIPREMKAVANWLGKADARQLDWAEVLSNIQYLRLKSGDRAILRVLHFLRENERVERQAAALRIGNFEEFLSLVRKSGDSSCKLLQNGYSTDASREQGIMLALAVTEDFLSRAGSGASRVHGGGFAGTIQVWLPTGSLPEYRRLIGGIFGANALVTLRVRKRGVSEL